MKKQKIKKFFSRYVYSIISSFFIFWTVFWAYTSFLITSQTADALGSSDSQISFLWTTSRQWYYVNNEDNSAVINNYFEWYYYDSLFWYFKLDWSTNSSNNVRIIDSTWKCPSWYWYKLWWKAYSDNGWFIDFNYNDDTFVYYCLNDWKLHWKSFSSNIWYQSFEWIEIALINDVIDLYEAVNNDSVFENDTTTINDTTPVNTSNDSNIWWDVLQLDITKESIFYIIK